MQVRMFEEAMPHYHRLQPAIRQQQDRAFFFRDDGVLFCGIDEWSAEELRAILGQKPDLNFEDIQDAFRLGMSVAWLRTTRKSECPDWKP